MLIYSSSAVDCNVVEEETAYTVKTGLTPIAAAACLLESVITCSAAAAALVNAISSCHQIDDDHDGNVPDGDGKFLPPNKSATGG